VSKANLYEGFIEDHIALGCSLKKSETYLIMTHRSAMQFQNQHK